MRILHVITGLALGGAETILYRLATRQSDFEHQVIVLAGRDWYSSRLEDHGILVHHLNISSVASLPAGIKRLNRLIRQSQADVVQCWLYAPNFAAGTSARFAGMPVVWGIHSSSLGPVKLATRMLTYAGGLFARWIPDFVINCSADSARIHARIGYSSAPGAVIHNGYDPSAFFPDQNARANARSELAISDHTFLIGSVARWDAFKDIPTLLSAVTIASAAIPLRCVLIGGGLDLGNPEFAKAVEDAGCGDAILPLGPRTDVPLLARAIDLHVLSSVSEAFPNVVAETMLSETPNVVTDVGDSAFIVGDSGWVVPPGNPEQLAASIVQAYREWSSSPAAWERRRTAARSRIADNFTFDKMADAYENIWRKVAARE